MGDLKQTGNNIFLSSHLGLNTNILQNRLNIFPKILKKSLNVPKNFLNISKNPLNNSKYLVFLFLKRPFLNLLGKKFLQRELKSISETVLWYYGNKATFKTTWMGSVKWETKMDYF